MSTDLPEVLVVFGGYRPTFAGAERMAWRTATELAATGHRVVAYTDSDRPDGIAAPAWPVLETATELAAHFADHTPDLVHAFDLAKPSHVDEAVRLAGRFGVPLALTPCSAPGVWPDREQCLAACRAADVLFALTGTEVDELTAAGVEADRIRLVPHAADLVGVARPDDFRAEHGIAERNVLFVGRRTAFKGYAALLAATELVWRELPDVDFVFAGPNSDHDTAEVFARHAGPRVHDLGVVDEVAKHDAIAACSVFCLPTSIDVFPLVFLEAWGCGKPVVSGDFPGVERVIRSDVDGLAVRPEPAALAEALVGLLTDERRRRAMGAAGARRVRDEYGWDRQVAEVRAGYEAVGWKARLGR